MSEWTSAEKIVQRLHVKWYGESWERTEPSGQFDMFDDMVAEILADRNTALETAARIADSNLDHNYIASEIRKLQEN